MSSIPNRPSLAALKAKKPPPQIMTKTVKVVSTAKRPSLSQTPSNSTPVNRSPNGVKNGIKRNTSTPIRSSAPSSRTSSKEPVERVRNARSNNLKRASPVVTTPQFTDSDSDEDDQPKKRQKTERKESIDTKRRIRNAKAFSEEDGSNFEMVHAADIANSSITEASRDKYEAYFTALAGEEDECPMIKLQYPGASQRERYQVVKPHDQTDFKPLSEIMENMKVVAEHYLDSTTAEKVDCEEDGSGLIQQLQRYARDGSKGRVGAQQKFIDVINKYNTLIESKRKDGTIARKLDEMTKVDVKLVEHIIKNQVYARTVSPQINLVRHYEGFSDNVYGELLPKFLSKIFKETRLKSDQVFVDLGSGVGNCVLQAALEIGCESVGCEMMDNPNTLAQLQAEEFPARCRLWGIKPGKVRLIHDDFLKNEEVGKHLRRADVVLINNQAFTPSLNNNLKYMFLDLKEGCQIVSLKYFRDPEHKIKAGNVNDPANLLTVREMERFSSMVSWSDDPGKWYLHKKDSKGLEEFEKKMIRAGTRA